MQISSFLTVCYLTAKGYKNTLYIFCNFKPKKKIGKVSWISNKMYHQLTFFLFASQKLTEEEFWSQPSKFTPESRVQAHRFMEEKRKEKDESSKSSFPDLNPPKRVIRFFNQEGRPLNINQDKIDFTFTENDDFTAYLLDVACYKHLGMF